MEYCESWYGRAQSRLYGNVSYCNERSCASRCVRNRRCLTRVQTVDMHKLLSAIFVVERYVHLEKERVVIFAGGTRIHIFN